MKRVSTTSISDLIKQYISDNNLEYGIVSARLINSWEAAVGKMIANSTKDLYVHKRKLYVTLSSSIVRHELMMIKTGLIARLNELAQANVIDDIIFR
ncbi:MAG: DUF721 domain-containing protein [Bacteroidales bacterium]|nr:DUF721 domain-containing protein [Bacteroidales bacterium]HQP03634.1 DUF721 domain-containing protein [Bacteroidales bacterium]